MIEYGGSLSYEIYLSSECLGFAGLGLQCQCSLCSSAPPHQCGEVLHLKLPFFDGRGRPAPTIGRSAEGLSQHVTADAAVQIAPK